MPRLSEHSGSLSATEPAGPNPVRGRDRPQGPGPALRPPRQGVFAASEAERSSTSGRRAWPTPMQSCPRPTPSPLEAVTPSMTPSPLPLTSQSPHISPAKLTAPARSVWPSGPGRYRTAACDPLCPRRLPRPRASARQRPVDPHPFQPPAFGADSGCRAVARQHSQRFVQAGQAAKGLCHVLLGSAGEICPAP
jgi:hypothetical protein